MSHPSQSRPSHNRQSCSRRPPGHQALSRLSNEDLVSSLGRLVGAERAKLVEILEHLNEVERRKLHLAVGCSSLFDYCVSRLKYSQSAAGRRIAAARALRRFPEIGAMLTKGQVNLATLSITANLLTLANKDAWLARIRGRSQREVKRMVEEVRPQTATRDRVQPVCVREPASAPGAVAVAGDEPTPSGGSGSRARAGHGAEAGGNQVGDNVDRAVAAAHVLSPAPTTVGDKRHAGTDLESPAVRVVHKHKMQFIVSEEFMRKVEAIKAMLSHRMPDASLEQVFDAAMEAFLEANCPARRDRRRKIRAGLRDRNAGKAGSRTVGTEVARVSDEDPHGDALPPVGVNPATDGVARVPSRAGGTAVPGKPTSRRIPAALRDAVFVRDRGRCTYISPTGHRCGSTRYLEIDHRKPFGQGGSHDASNLRLLCRAHNQLAADHAYGHDKMSAFVRRE